MLDKLHSQVKKVVLELYASDVDFDIERSHGQFGDFSTNVALKLAAKLSRPPKVLAQEIADLLTQEESLFSKVEVAGNGFINFFLTVQSLFDQAVEEQKPALAGQVIVVEYSDPNPFKALHAGHLYTSVVGESIAKLLEGAGANIKRVNYGGDVGPHVAKCLYGIINRLGGENPDQLNSIREPDRANWLSECYVEGNKAYETDEAAQVTIRDINKKVYDIVASNDHKSNLSVIYWTCRQWSYDYFDAFYKRLNIKFDKNYPESSVAELGFKTVESHIPEVYKKSDGAVIFEGKKYGLFDNVFINSQGLPTYSAKEVGLLMQKWKDYNFDLSIIITASEQADYMRVVSKSVEQFEPKLASRSVHLTHGVVKLTGGRKMSSRLGKVVNAVDIIAAAEEATKERGLDVDDRVTFGAVKYAFLKQRLGGDIIYDPSESVSIEGNSGPYLQYAYVRAKSILAKADKDLPEISSPAEDISDHERILLVKIGEFNEMVEKARVEFKPSYVASYLYELAQIFNRFYENSRVIGDAREGWRLWLVDRYSKILRDGLAILGIAILDKM